ncbi:MAG: hypothetical protein HWN68_05170 [Desulfobacterales bacterium]|nr:hypothetical protein [Desulfobacterales bacterium]
MNTDHEVLARLAERSYRFDHDEKTRTPTGMLYEKTEAGDLRPAILDRHLEIVANNPYEGIGKPGGRDDRGL